MLSISMNYARQPFDSHLTREKRRTDKECRGPCAACYRAQLAVFSPQCGSTGMTCQRVRGRGHKLHISTRRAVGMEKEWKRSPVGHKKHSKLQADFNSQRERWKYWVQWWPPSQGIHKPFSSISDPIIAMIRPSLDQWISLHTTGPKSIRKPSIAECLIFEDGCV